MIDGIPPVDAHVHAASLPGLELGWEEWTGGFPLTERRLYTTYSSARNVA